MLRYKIHAVLASNYALSYLRSSVPAARAMLLSVLWVARYSMKRLACKYDFGAGNRELIGWKQEGPLKASLHCRRVCGCPHTGCGRRICALRPKAESASRAVLWRETRRCVLIYACSSASTTARA